MVALVARVVRPRDAAANFAQEHLPSTLCLTVYLPNLDDLELG